MEELRYVDTDLQWLSLIWQCIFAAEIMYIQANTCPIYVPEQFNEVAALIEVD